MTERHSGDEHSAAYAKRVRRLLDDLDARGVVRKDEVLEIADRVMRSDGLANGARIIARAWADPGFRERLLQDATEAIRELGLDMSRGMMPHLELRVVANSPDEHNVVVCTLCSCYPVAILGPPPGWYKSEAYRARVVRDPRGVLAEFGCRLPAGTRITVWDSSSEIRYMVLPLRPDGTQGWTEEQLAELVTLESIVGTDLPRSPAPVSDLAGA